MLRHEDDVDAVIICGAESCEAASRCSTARLWGKFFSLNGDLDGEELLSELCSFSIRCSPRGINQFFRMETKGYVHVYTGNGKGKTTAAFDSPLGRCAGKGV